MCHGKDLLCGRHAPVCQTGQVLSDACIAHGMDAPLSQVFCALPMQNAMFLLQLTERTIEVGSAEPQLQHWLAHEVKASAHFLEYIPGRDQLWDAPALAAGHSPS